MLREPRKIFPSILLLSALRASAHDFWIEPSTFLPEPGSPLAIRLRVGDHFQGEIVPRSSAHMKRFFLAGPAGREETKGVEGMDPAGYALVPGPGFYAIGYESARNSSELEAKKFEDYLREEGLEQVIRLRAERGDTERAGREVYHRYAKALIWAGKSRLDDTDRTLGFPLEIVAEKNPYLLHSGEDLPVRLLFRSVPLPDALVTAIAGGTARSVSGRTDDDGRVRLKLAQRGVFLVKAVHMVTASQGAKAEWESYWASLTFQLTR